MSKCESCGEKIEVPGEDPDLCAECEESIFSGPGITVELTSLQDLVDEID